MTSLTACVVYVLGSLLELKSAVIVKPLETPALAATDIQETALLLDCNWMA